MNVSSKFVTATLFVAVACGYALELAHGGMAACYAYGFVPAHPTLAGAVGSLFLHDPASWGHILANLAFLAVFGAVIEDTLGGLTLAALFLVGGLAGAACHAVVNPLATTPLVGCSGAVFAVVIVAGVMRPRLIGFGLALGAVAVWQTLFNGDAMVSGACHVGGLIAGAFFSAAAYAVGAGTFEEA